MHSKRESVLQLEAAHGGESREEVAAPHIFTGKLLNLSSILSLADMVAATNALALRCFLVNVSSRAANSPNVQPCTVSSATTRRKTHTQPSTMFQVSTHYTARPSQLITAWLRINFQSACANLPLRASLE